MSTLPQQQNGWRNPLLLSAAYALVMTPANVSPFLVVAMMSDLSLTESQAGLVLTLELVTLAATSCLLAPLVLRVTVSKILLWGVIVALVGHSLSMFVDTAGTLVVTRIIAGVGAGLLLIGVNIGAAAMQDPVKIYGLANTMGLLIAALMFLVLPTLAEKQGLFGVYVPLTLIALVVLTLIPLMLEPNQSGTRCKHVLPASVSHGKLFCLLLALIITPATFLSFYVFSEPIGTATGLSSQQMGTLLAAVQIAGIAATGCASYIGSRYGIFIPLLIALGSLAVLITVATVSGSRMVFIFTFIPINTLFLFSIPYQLSIGATLDKTGRLGAISVGTFYFGSSFGPYLGGFLLAKSGAPAIGMVVCAGVAIALFCFAYVTKPVSISNCPSTTRQ